MPNEFDFFSLYVQLTISGSLNVNPADVTVDSGEVANFAFMYRPGKPLATAFSVTWYTDSGRTTEGSGSLGGTFTPATPQSDADAVASPGTFHSGSMAVTAPTLEAVESEAEATPVPYYGRMTLHQV